MHVPVLLLLREWLDVPIEVGCLVRGSRATADGVTTDTRGVLHDATWLSFVLEAKPWFGGCSRSGRDAWHQVGGTGHSSKGLWWCECSATIPHPSLLNFKP
jgi:hypothetical protein